MAIQDFSFTGKKSRSIADRQAILVLDEEKDVDTLTNTLKKLRYHILGISIEVKEVIELMRKHKHGVLVLDFDLADYSSADFLKKVKINFPNIKVVLAAKVMDKQQITTAKENGVAGFLAKPLKQDPIANLLAKL